MLSTSCRRNKAIPAVFFDRDGTLIEDRGHLSSAADVRFFADTVEALRQLRNEFLLFIVTNQPGVAEGVIKAADVNRVNMHVISFLARAGVKITDVYVCPHKRSENCACIKPNPYFLLKAARHHGVDLEGSFVVGDHPHDVELARNSGACGIFVLTGHGAKHCHEIPYDTIVAEGILEASELILNLCAHPDRLPKETQG